MNTIPTRPSPLVRLWRWFCVNLHDKAERIALENRLIALDSLEEEVRLEIKSIRAVQFSGSGRAAAEAAQQIKARGHELDSYRGERLRVRQRLAALSN